MLTTRMTWLSPLPYAVIDRRIREILAERMERGATDELDRRLRGADRRATTARARGMVQLMTFTRQHGAQGAELTIRMTVVHTTEQAALKDGFHIGVDWLDQHGG